MEDRNNESLPDNSKEQTQPESVEKSNAKQEKEKVRIGIFSILFILINSAVILLIGLIFIVGILGMDTSGNILPRRAWESVFFYVLGVISTLGVFAKGNYDTFSVGSKDSSGKFKESMDITDQGLGGCMSILSPFAVGFGLALLPYYLLYWLAGITIAAIPYILTGLIGILAIALIVFYISMYPLNKLSSRIWYNSIVFILFGGILLLVLPMVAQTKAFMKAAGTFDERAENYYLAGDLKRVREGTFMMGDTSTHSPDNVRPLHQVDISEFHIGKYEVTLAQFNAFIEDSGYVTTADKRGYSYVYVNKDSPLTKKTGINWQFNGTGEITAFSYAPEEFPVVHVSRADAEAYCHWLTRKTGLQHRLPTESEWEYAARGGRKNKGRLYSGSNTAKRVAYYEGATGRGLLGGTKRPQKVGEKRRNEIGVYDMSGNVREYCSDFYGPYPGTTQENPVGPERGTFTIVRGGGFNSSYKKTKVFARDSVPQNYTAGNLGFRIVRESTVQPPIYKILYEAVMNRIESKPDTLQVPEQEKVDMVRRDR